MKYWRSNRGLGQLLVIAGVLILSVDAPLVRLSGLEPLNLSFWRGVLVTSSLVVMLRVTKKVWVWRLLWDAPNIAVPLASAACMSIGGMAFVFGVQTGSVAKVVVIYATTPFLAAVCSIVMLKEFAPLRTWLASLVAVVGVALIARHSAEMDILRLDIIALGGAMAVALSFTLLRCAPEVDRFAVTASNGVCTMIFSSLVARPQSIPLLGLPYVLVLGLVVLPVAGVLIGEATKYLSSSEVSLFLLLETILAPIWVYLIFGDQPASSTWFGAIFILAALLWIILVDISGVSARRVRC
ncbi:MAG: DMT family transporter [Myxococcales bacterium]|nr:DMT family transporter [Myxococcales bacterium]